MSAFETMLLQAFACLIIWGIAVPFIAYYITKDDK